ncbi:MAG: transcription antitermination factor NusB [Actinomycetota bacterium]|nr:transcription antitermination factor NusB [Actinomycetota bacterium]
MTEDPFAPQPAAQRREARERAIELLYEAELRAAPAAEILEDQLVALDPFVIELVLGVTSNVEELDAEIGSLLKKEWSLDRLGMLDLWILRLGVHELLRHDAPVAVVINEAVELGNRFGATEESGRFINGVLGAAARRFE